MPKISGSDMLIKFLEDSGVEKIYGYPGGAALHIYDSLFKSSIEHILVRHEQAAVHMADGYARATGETGVVLVTSGPGATNTITGIATAYMDSIPMVVICGQVMEHLIGLDAFQEIDIVGISRPVVKHSYIVNHAKDIPKIMNQAFHLANSGRPGPVLVDIPKNITAPDELHEYIYPSKPSIRSYHPLLEHSKKHIKEAVKLMQSAKKPIIYYGGGVVLSKSDNELKKLAKTLQCPVTSTLMGLGAFPASDSQFVGMLGMHGTFTANNAMHESDLIIALGVRFDDRVTNNPKLFCKNAKIIHVDIDPTSIDKIIEVDLPIIGDLKIILKDILEEISSSKKKIPLNKDWIQQIDIWKNSKPSLQDYKSTENSIKPQEVIHELWLATKDKDAYITSDVGQHQMFVAQHYNFDKPNRWISSGGLGTMGFGFPAAMGISAHNPKATVACVTSEGSIQMNIQELSTCKQYDFPVKIINLNNGRLGMIKQWQDMLYNSRYSHSYMESLPDFTKLVEAYGMKAIRVTKLSELRSKMEECFAIKDKLVFMDIQIDQDEHVYPMQIPGKSMNEMILEKKK
jgi:acetolactate synthase-1/2/3 large subunit